MRKKIQLKLISSIILIILITSYFTFSILNLINKNNQEVLSITSFQWIQADWSQGVGQSISDQYQNATNIDDSEIGQISIIKKSNWCNNSVCDGNWTKRKKITITNTDTAESDYQINVKINYETSMNTDFSDLRFTNNNGDNLAYWIYNKNDGSDADVWVKVDNLPLGDTEIYMYYGNSNANSISNGEDTFIFFDDFNDNSINTTKWNEIDPNNEIDESNGTLNFNRSTNGAWNRGIIAQPSFTRANLSLEADYEWTQNNPAYDAIMYGWHDNTTNPSYQYLVYAFYNPGTGNANTVGATVYEDGTHRNGVTGSWTINTQYQIRVRIKASGGAFYEQSTDGGNTWVINYDSSYSTESNLHPALSFYSGHHKYDNARIRKWMDTEPTYIFDLEETVYETNAELISNVFHVDDTTINWGNLSYNSAGNGTIEIRARTASDTSMNDAVAFIGCDPIPNNTDLSDNNCVEDNKSYIQYKVNFISDGTDTPILTEVKIVGEKGTEDPPLQQDTNNNTDNNIYNPTTNTIQSIPTTSTTDQNEINNPQDSSDTITNTKMVNNDDNQNIKSPPEVLNLNTSTPITKITNNDSKQIIKFKELLNFGLILFSISSFVFIITQIFLIYQYQINIQTTKIIYNELTQQYITKNLSNIEQFTKLNINRITLFLKFLQILILIGIMSSIIGIIKILSN